MALGSCEQMCRILLAENIIKGDYNLISKLALNSKL